MIKGIYYEQKTMETGTMGTKQASTHSLHYWLKENETGKVDIYILKPDGNPTAIVVETVTKEDFNNRFHDCSTHSCEFKVKTPEEKLAEKAETKVRIGEKHLEKKECHAATYEFGQALAFLKTLQ